MDYLSLRKKLIEKDFGRMNSRQFEAVTTVNGPLLVLAGAGSGKTTVLVNRIANLVKYGNAYQSAEIPAYGEDDIAAGERYLSGEDEQLCSTAFAVDAPQPWQILAITFTNKAAGELKERIVAKLGTAGNDVWAGTFHSVCGKILRYNADRIGHTSHFTIYDTDDQRRLMKEIMKQLGIDEKFLAHKAVLSAISSAKDELVSPEEFEQTAGNDPRNRQIARLYKAYQKRLFEADAMDFDDMIVKTVRLFQENEDVLTYYSDKFRYIMVDEYQDTNHAQYELVALLSTVHGNLCVVGDDDQSIYRFRGATIENILHFEEQFSGAKTIRLEQNYRSTGNILDAANAVIQNNRGRKGKNLWTEHGAGEKISVHTASDERGEARYVADKILENVRKGARFSDHAVLYRMNAQSASLENVFARSGISYKVIGGFRFFERKEIRDVLAYLHLINNNKDDVRLRRIINEPKRGIGETTVSKASEIAQALGLSLFEVFRHADEYAAISRAAAKLTEFCKTVEQLTEKAQTLTISALFEEMLDATGYRAALQADPTNEGKDRLENVGEFETTIRQYESENEEPSLSGFLEEIALVSDTDALDADDDKAVLMTIHSAKGLEFNQVFLVGMEDGIFPGTQSIFGGEAELEEERRLAYVAITRARKELTVTNTRTRMLYGKTERYTPSRFLKEIPPQLCAVSAEETDDYGMNTFGGYRHGSFAQNREPAWGERESSYTPIRRQGAVSFGRSAAAEKPKATPACGRYTAGQRVRHKTFGDGTVMKSTPLGNDQLLEIKFDRAGLKKLMATFAKLENL